MNKKRPATTSLKEFKKKFTNDQLKQIEEEVKYYDLLTKFKEAREIRGLTQERLAQKAKINRTTLSKVETGSRNATVGTLMRLAQAMEMNLELKLY